MNLMLIGVVDVVKDVHNVWGSMGVLVKKGSNINE